MGANALGGRWALGLRHRQLVADGAGRSDAGNATLHAYAAGKGRRAAAWGRSGRDRREWRVYHPRRGGPAGAEASIPAHDADSVERSATLREGLEGCKRL